MKCCDSGLSRRKKAAEMLYAYLEEHSNKNIIVLGDWNDDLKDFPSEHCFSKFILDEKYFCSPRNDRHFFLFRHRRKRKICSVL